MIIKNLETPIVCDTLGCGKIAKSCLTFSTGHRILLCEDCLKELFAAVEKEKKNDRKQTDR